MGTKKGAGQTAPTMEKPKPTEQAKNASIQADTDAHALPEITVRIDKRFCDTVRHLRRIAVLQTLITFRDGLFFLLYLLHKYIAECASGHTHRTLYDHHVLFICPDICILISF